jgi:integrase/recombinase XerD
VAALAAYRPRSLTGKRAHAAACLILDCGARLAEVLQLRASDLLLEDLLVRIHGKGGKERFVPISPGLRRILWSWIKGKRPDEFVLATQGGPPLSARNGLRDLHIIFRHLGIEGSRLAWHALRHTFAVNYIRAGGDVFRLQRILGHSTLEMTRHYVNLQTEDLQAVHQRFSVLARSLA